MLVKASKKSKDIKNGEQFANDDCDMVSKISNTNLNLISSFSCENRKVFSRRSSKQTKTVPLRCKPTLNESHKRVLLCDKRSLSTNFFLSFVSSHNFFKLFCRSRKSFSEPRLRFMKSNLFSFHPGFVTLISCLILFIYFPFASSAPLHKSISSSFASLNENNSSSLNPVLFSQTTPTSATLTSGNLLTVVSTSKTITPHRGRDTRQNVKTNRRRKGGNKRRRKNKKSSGNRRRKSSKKKRRKGKKTRIRKKNKDKVRRNQKNSRNQQNVSSERYRLYNKAGSSFHLAVWKNGRVGGEESEKRSNYTILEIKLIEGGGVVSIYGIAARKYICVTKKGRIKALKKYKRRSCRFKHSYLENKQSSYESLSCKGCLLNLNKRGKVKRLKGINPNLRPAHFLPREIGRTLASKREKVVTIDFSNYLPNNTGEPVIEAKRSSFTADEKLRDSIRNDKVQSKKDPRAPSEQSNNFARHFSPKKRINNKSDAGLMKIITNAQFD